MRLLAIALLPAMLGCALPRPSEIPEEPPWIVAVKSCRVSDSQPWIARTAQHTWIDVKGGSEDDWYRFEVPGRGGVRNRAIDGAAARRDVRWGEEARVVRLVAGEEARAAAAALAAAAEGYEDKARYRAWPGPNSNTYTARLGRRTPGLAFELDHNAAGKDYAPLFRLGGTTTKTGIAADTPFLGFAVGLREGLELHLIQVTFGVSLFPPALKVPVLPRIGFRW